LLREDILRKLWYEAAELHKESLLSCLEPLMK